MKRFTGLLNRTKSGSGDEPSNPNGAAVDSPAANAARSIRLFCESGASSNRDEEVLHLPVIVEAAESSPQAANAAALQIKAFLAKSYASKAHVQYNSIMLVRILSDHPGPTFTRCFDQSFVKTVKELLRGCRDHSTQQILRETLDSLEVNKSGDEGVAGLIAMWRKEKGSSGSLSHANQRRGPPPQNYHSGHSNSRSHSDHRVFQRNQLPEPHELSSRVEEARNTAKILLQLIQSTPKEELLASELAREFNERCQSAQKSMQTYINCDSPSPDDDTMLTLIETNEQLSLAGTRYQRVMLEARRALGQNASPNNMEALNDGYGAFTTPAAPGQAESLFAAAPVQRQGTNGSQSQSQTSNYTDYSSYQPPSGPPPQRSATQQSYQPPPGPPPQHSLPSPQNQNQARAPYPPPENTASNPFLDPAPLAFEPTNHGNPSPSTRKPAPAARSNTADLENAYTTSSSPVSPVRPNHAGVTPSYLGRQESALGGLTMHGASGGGSYRGNGGSGGGYGSAGGLQELDGHSNVGRRDRDGDEYRGGDRDGAYDVSPVEARRVSGRGSGSGVDGGGNGNSRRLSRVDVLGTGGLRGA